MKNINSSTKISIICYGFSALVFFAIGIQGAFISAGDEMGYCVLNFYMIMPLTTLIASLIISMKKGYLFWLYPIFAGTFGIMIPFVVFSTFDGIDLFFAFFPALIGLVIGLIISFIIRVKIKK